MKEQLSLFAPPNAPPPAAPRGGGSGGDSGAEGSRPGRALGPASVPPRLHALARQRPPGLFLGTSSWSFPGWAGLVYDRVASERTLSHRGLRAYAQHPLFQAVGVDRTHYAPMRAADLRAYADDVPAHFRFLVKAHDALTLPVFPRHRRYGARAGEPNARYLDPAYATDVVAGPVAEALGDKLYALLFQFAPQAAGARDEPSRFAARIHDFLRALPGHVPCAVEVRNAEWLGVDLGAALQDAGAIPCLSSITAMPSPRVQSERLGGLERFGPRVLCRWLLHRGHRYEDAYRAYHPFSALVEEDTETRGELAALACDALRAGRQVMVIVNNKAEGCAPRSIARLHEAIVSGGVAGGSPPLR